MEEYRLRPGVALTVICGEYVLIATNKARPHCPYVNIVSESGAFLLRHLLRGATMPELVSLVLQEYELEDAARAEALISGFVQQMRDCGYLLREGETADDE